MVRLGGLLGHVIQLVDVGIGQGRVTGNITARARCDLRAPGQVVGNITAPIITMEEGVRFDGEMTMSGVLEDVVRAPTKRAPAPLTDPGTSTVKPGLAAPTASGRRSTPPSRDPSELLKPVP